MVPTDEVYHEVGTEIWFIEATSWPFSLTEGMAEHGTPLDSHC